MKPILQIYYTRVHYLLVVLLEDLIQALLYIFTTPVVTMLRFHQLLAQHAPAQTATNIRLEVQLIMQQLHTLLPQPLQVSPRRTL